MIESMGKKLKVMANYFGVIMVPTVSSLLLSFLILRRTISLNTVSGAVNNETNL